MWFGALFGSLCFMTTIQSGFQMDIMERNLINKYLVGMSEEQLDRFDVKKHMEEIEKITAREGADIKEKWGGKQLLMPEFDTGVKIQQPSEGLS